MAFCHLEIRGSANQTRPFPFEDDRVDISVTKCEHSANSFDAVVIELQFKGIHYYMLNNLIDIWNDRLTKSFFKVHRFIIFFLN